MTEDEFFKLNPDTISTQYSKPLYECPKCGKLSVCRFEGVVFTTYPPQHRYDCLECGYSTVR